MLTVHIRVYETKKKNGVLKRAVKKNGRSLWWMLGILVLLQVEHI